MNDENKFIDEYEDLNVIDVDEALVESEAPIIRHYLGVNH